MPTIYKLEMTSTGTHKSDIVSIISAFTGTNSRRSLRMANEMEKNGSAVVFKGTKEVVHDVASLIGDYTNLNDITVVLNITEDMGEY